MLLSFAALNQYQARNSHAEPGQNRRFGHYRTEAGHIFKAPVAGGVGVGGAGLVHIVTTGEALTISTAKFRLSLAAD